jgi:hypothetical protein
LALASALAAMAAAPGTLAGLCDPNYDGEKGTMTIKMMLRVRKVVLAVMLRTKETNRMPRLRLTLSLQLQPALVVFKGTRITN